MNLRNRLPLVALVLATCGMIRAAEAAPPAKPNILFIFSDDHALQAISAYNYGGLSINKTPNVDRLASEGAIFRSNYCGNSICSPSRATVLTGKHSHLNGVTSWQAFDGSQFTFPKSLQTAGYQTAIFGKWHLKSKPTGFDEWMVHPGQGSYYNPDFITPTGNRKIDGYAPDITTDLSLDFLKRNKDSGKPFLVMCQYNAPHRTWQPSPATLDHYADAIFPEPATLFDDYSGRSGPAANHKMGIGKHLQMDYDLKVPADKSAEWELMTQLQREGLVATYANENEAFTAANLVGDDLTRWKYQRYLRDYLRCVDSVDNNVGRLLDYLKETGLDQNTIVVYSSDQGFYLGEHGWFDKRWMYEESFLMPLLVRWPGVVKPGTEIKQLTQNIDFAPTFLEAAGLPVPADIQGISLMPLLKGGQVTWRDALYYHYYDGPSEHGVAKHYGVRTERYKLIRFYADADNTWELYDLENDPHEMKSVYNDPAYAEIRAELTTRLDELKQQYTNPIRSEADENAYFTPEISLEDSSGLNLSSGSTADTFGKVKLDGNSIRVFVIRNTGNAKLTGLAITKSGSHAGDYLVAKPAARTLTPGTSTTFTVTFKPKAHGLRSAVIHLASNDADVAPFMIKLTGACIQTRHEITVMQPAGNRLLDGVTKMSFGTVNVGKTGTAKTFTIKNTGKANLTGLAITKGGAQSNDFVAGAVTKSSLVPGEFATFKLSFKPTAKGTRNAAIHIKSNEAIENLFDIKLTGSGAAP